MMQTDAQLTSSPKDTDTQTPVEHLTATSKHTHICMCAGTHIKNLKHTHTHTKYFFNARNTNAHLFQCSLTFRPKLKTD